MRVLSLFDGISCGMVALERAMIPVELYDAYEIEESAIRISKRNYPKINHKGDVTKAEYTEGQYDLIIGGSPCQSLSNVNVWLKDGEYGIDGTGKSNLFYEYIRALRTVKPKYFLFENVASMKKADQDKISKLLGVKPVLINSADFSPQTRNRLYWTNIEILPHKPVETTMQDILQGMIPDKYYISENMKRFILTPCSKGWKSGKMQIDLPKARPITATVWKGRRADTDNYVTDNFYHPTNKTNIRRLTPVECERLQTLPDYYTEGESDKNRYIAIGNGWTVDVIAHILKGVK